MSDWIERLRNLQHFDVCYPVPHPLCDRAADELVRLRAENERLREALSFYARESHYSADTWPPVMSDLGTRARAALEGEG